MGLGGAIWGLHIGIETERNGKSAGLGDMANVGGAGLGWAA